ncbi:MAG: lipoyl synthase [Candidatus Omnitrophica bacterium]|nr:lipoyl synthase [Candidatus Omnitrophota bacterium]
MNIKAKHRDCERKEDFFLPKTKRLPFWFRQELPTKASQFFYNCLKESRLNTVCLEAACPNINRCFKNKAVTFMILGTVCTRFCGFCNVSCKKKIALTVDKTEPERIAKFVKKHKISQVVITSVTRDDLEDGGAKFFACTIQSIRKKVPSCFIEILIPDFKANINSLVTVANTSVNIIGHNIETVPRLYPILRPQADYQRSLKVLAVLKSINKKLVTKSALMVGLGEKKEEVFKAMQDLREVDCDILMVGQYLAPSKNHAKVKEFVSLACFEQYRKWAEQLGFRQVHCAPLVRSSLRFS